MSYSKPTYKETFQNRMNAMVEKDPTQAVNLFLQICKETHLPKSKRILFRYGIQMAKACREMGAFKESGKVYLDIFRESANKSVFQPQARTGLLTLFEEDNFELIEFEEVKQSAIIVRWLSGSLLTSNEETDRDILRVYWRTYDAALALETPEGVAIADDLFREIFKQGYYRGQEKDEALERGLGCVDATRILSTTAALSNAANLVHLIYNSASVGSLAEEQALSRFWPICEAALLLPDEKGVGIAAPLIQQVLDSKSKDAATMETALTYGWQCINQSLAMSYGLGVKTAVGLAECIFKNTETGSPANQRAATQLTALDFKLEGDKILESPPLDTLSVFVNPNLPFHLPPPSPAGTI